MQISERLPDFSKNDLNEWFMKHELVQLFVNSFDLPLFPLLSEALSHKSFIHEFNQFDFKSYEKLELLGDSLLGSWVTRKIYKDYPHLDEGKLSKLRSAIVNEDHLSLMVESLGLESLILLGKGELNARGHERSSLKSDIFESLIGGIYLDLGDEKLNNFLDRCLEKFEKMQGRAFISEELLLDFDPKSSFQELLMKSQETFPRYEVLKRDGSLFKVGLFIGEKKILEKRGDSKKKLEKELARLAIKKKLYLR